MTALTWNETLALNHAQMDRTHEEFVDLLAACAAALPGPDADLLRAFDQLTQHGRRARKAARSQAAGAARQARATGAGGIMPATRFSATSRRAARRGAGPWPGASGTPRQTGP